MKLLLVEDDQEAAAYLKRALEEAGHAVEHAEEGREGLLSAAGNPYDVIILDRMLPEMDGLAILRTLRAARVRTPVLLLTALDGIDDRVEGLEAGADDYLVKPFALKELKARLRALLRRAETADEGEDARLRFADLALDRAAWEARRGSRGLELSRTEFQLLAMFMEHPRQVLTRSQIFERVWGYDFGSSSNSLGVYMGYLRRKTEEGGEPRLLHTVRGVGYVLRD